MCFVSKIALRAAEVRACVHTAPGSDIGMVDMYGNLVQKYHTNNADVGK